MRLLFLSLTFPLPANNGHKMRTWALLRALHSEGHEVTLLVFSSSSSIEEGPIQSVMLDQIFEVCHEIQVVSLARTNNIASRNDYSGRLISLLCTHPYTVWRFESKLMQAKIREHLEGGSYEAVVCDIFTAANLSNTNVPIVLNNENVEHIIFQRYLARERNPLKRAYAWVEWRKLYDWEGEVCRRAAVGMACSELEREKISMLAPGLRTVLVPNVVDIDAYSTQEVEEPDRILFQGAMDWFPNRDAVECFISSVLPELRRRSPDVKLVIAGRNPPKEFIERFAPVPGVTFTGTIPNIRVEIARATVCVVPLRIGSGTRLKILEAAAMAKPIVSTTLGAEGLEFVDGKDIVLVDTPLAFAQAVAALLDDASRRRELGAAARRCVEDRYSFQSLRLAVRKAIAELEPISKLKKPHSDESRLGKL